MQQVNRTTMQMCPAGIEFFACYLRLVYIWSINSAISNGPHQANDPSVQGFVRLPHDLSQPEYYYALHD
jgi:hypothetical protein